MTTSGVQLNVYLSFRCLPVDFSPVACGSVLEVGASGQVSDKLCKDDTATVTFAEPGLAGEGPLHPFISQLLRVDSPPSLPPSRGVRRVHWVKSNQPAPLRLADGMAGGLKDWTV